MKKIKIGVIGTGRLGALHLKMYAQLKNKVEIVGVCDTNEKIGRDIARDFHTTFFHDFRTLIGQVDAVSVCTPTENHFEIAHFFLDNGVHTFKSISNPAQAL